MGYWSEVSAQAAKETLAEMRWTGPLKVAQSVVPTAASGLATWLATGQPAHSTLASIAALVAVASLWFAHRMIAIPARMDAAAQGKIKSLTPRQDQLPSITLKADTPLIDAIFFAANGVWGDRSVDDLPGLKSALDDFHQIAADNHMRVWYRSFEGGVWDVLEPSGWKAHYVDLRDVLAGDAIMRRRRDGTVIETCKDMRVCREQMTIYWPIYQPLLP